MFLRGFSQRKEGRGPCRTTTYGVGEQIKDAAKKGVKRIIICLGGSCTNDAGCGAAFACGVEFRDKDGRLFMPTGGTLEKIENIDISGMDPQLKNIDITVICDVENPATGPYGAAKVFAPQKGASLEDVILLEKGMKHFCEIVRKDLGKDVENIPGGGAAGGMGAGMKAFYECNIRSGIETVLEINGFDEKVRMADWVITGEGRIDSQSLKGKTVSGVVMHAEKAGKKTIIIAGSVKDDEIREFYHHNVAGIFSLCRKAEAPEETFAKTEENLNYTLENILRLISGSDRYDDVL